MATLTQPLKLKTPRDWRGVFILVFINLVGIAAFMTPFFAGALPSGDSTTSRSGESPLLLGGLVIACLGIVFAQLSPTLNTKTIALLGVLTAINSILRLIDTIIPLPGGFSPVFLLIILVGYVYGASLGFLLGTLTLFSSALLTGGVGPWLPFQMFTAGWMGLLAGWLPRPEKHPRLELAILVIFAALAGFLYGFIINLYFWPFLAGAAQQSWQPGLSIEQGIARYMVFYGLTSFWWDVFAAIGNATLMGALGAALVRALRRYQSRFFPTIIQEPVAA